MASRMERYRENVERSTKNEDLYRSIQDTANYSNIEEVVSIDTTNEIDITKVKAMLQNRENYQKRKQYTELVDDETPSNYENIEYDYTDKNYDIKEFLDKAKEDSPQPSEYRTLKHTQYNILEKLNLNATPEEETALQELIDTIALRNKEEEKVSTEDGGLLDDLKSNTMVGDATSIRKIINSAKEEEQHLEENKTQGMNLEKIDKSFYTSSLGFTDTDFDDIKNLDKSISTHNKLLIALIILIVSVIVIIACYFFIKTIF